MIEAQRGAYVALSAGLVPVSMTNNLLQPRRCPRCGIAEDLDFVDPELRLPAGMTTVDELDQECEVERDADIAYTEDGRLIVSARLDALANGDPGWRTIPMPSQPGCYLLAIERTVRVDPADSPAAHGQPCYVCGRSPEYTYGNHDIHLVGADSEPSGWYRTDALYGGLDQHPLTLVARSRFDELQRLGVRGMDINGVVTFLS